MQNEAVNKAINMFWRVELYSVRHFSTVLLTNRRKIRQQECDSEFVFVHEGKDKDLLLKNAFYTICSTRRLIYLLH